MAISTFEIKICGQKLCAQKDGFRKSGHKLSEISICVEFLFQKSSAPAVADL